MIGRLRRAAWRAHERTLSMNIDWARERGDEALSARYYAALVEHQNDRPLVDSLVDPWPVRVARDELEERRRRASDREQWFESKTLAEHGEVTARWLEGKVVHNDSYNGRPDPETEVLARPLAAANRAGFVTDCSQPGGSWDGWAQRAAADGFAVDDATRDRLEQVAARHGLTFISHKAPMLRNDYSAAETVTAVRGDGDGPEAWRPHTNFGAAVSRGTIRDGMIITANEDVLDEAAYAWQVTLMDPDWGTNARLVAALDEFSGRTPDEPAALFSDEQQVQHRLRAGGDGGGLLGTVVHPPCGGAPAVVWRGTNVSEPLADVAADLLPYAPPGLPEMPRPAPPAPLSSSSEPPAAYIDAVRRQEADAGIQRRYRALQADAGPWNGRDPETMRRHNEYEQAVDDQAAIVSAAPPIGPALPDLAVCPESGMAHRRMDDGTWHVLDVVGEGAGDPAPPPGSVTYSPSPEAPMSHTAFGYADGDEVVHKEWRDPDGQPARGRVRLADLTDEERAEGGYAVAEIRWNGAAFPTELDAEAALDVRRPETTADTGPGPEQVAAEAARGRRHQLQNRIYWGRGVLSDDELRDLIVQHQAALAEEAAADKAAYLAARRRPKAPAATPPPVTPTSPRGTSVSAPTI